MADFTPVLTAQFCQPEETMLLGKKLIKMIKELRIALPTITGTPIMALPTDTRYRIRVHIPGRTFAPVSEEINFQFPAPNWEIGRDIAIHRTLGRIREAYRAELEIMDSEHVMVSRRTAAGEIVRTRDDDSILSYVQELEIHINDLQTQVRRDTRTVKALKDREVELEDNIREANFEHEEEVKDFLERIQKLKKYIANLEEKLDQGENLHPEGDEAPYMSNEDDYEDSTTGGSDEMDF